ncbi:response regulator transcription factor [Sphingomonas sp. R1]|uniref:response regulator transcription factor n=1 Tax=Sphingomonas sp. R1 TaxID=399176 RepID=UPI0022259BE1|nr:response regulator transcription factor [Sphingomonas sp. R1]UYY76777.1 response regulator transcription factor [Sphingomonas sp. R1]
MPASPDASPALHALVVEDDVQLNALLVQQLGGLGYEVTAVGDGRAALAALAEARFDVVLLDRMLPVIEGVEVLRRMRSEGIETPVILLTALGLTNERVEGLDAGADDYIVKPFEIDELNARIRAVLRRRAAPATDNAALTAGDVTVSVVRHRVTRAGKPIELQKTELKLLAELVREAGSVLSRKMLIERVWGYDFVPSTNIVDVHILKLRQRLDMPGLPDPIVTVRGVGYMFRA